ncbi:MAG: hypothetical protein AABY13_04255, partial [Nanoarchaeota archaeon]
MGECATEVVAMTQRNGNAQPGANGTAPPEVKNGAPTPKRRHTASLEAYVEESNKLFHGSARSMDADELSQRHNGDVYAVVSGGEDIKDAYTLGDRVKLWLSGVAEKAGDSTGLRVGERTRQSREGIEARILAERIKQYKQCFDATLKQAREIASYCRERLDEYGAMEADNKIKSIEYIGKAQEMDELMRERAQEIDYLTEGALHAQSAHERMELGKERARKKQVLASADNSQGDYVRHAGVHTRIAKINKVQYISMRAKYQCVAKQASIIMEKGMYIDQVLHDYASGANIKNIAMLRQRARECGLIQGELHNLDKKYTEVERLLHVTDS